MRAHWHFPAIGAAAALFINALSIRWLIVPFFGWFCYLLYKQRLRQLPAVFTVASFIFFLVYSPPLPVEESNSSASVSWSAPAKGEVIAGEIITPVTVTNKKIEFILEEEQTMEQLLIVHFPNNDKTALDLQPLKHGAKCSISGKKEIPPESRNPGQFDYRNYLLSNNISHQIVLDTTDEVLCTGSSYLQPIYSFRTFLLTRVEQQLSEKTAAWLQALVLGYDDAIDEETLYVFERWGLSHLLAISGLHVGIVIGVIYVALVKLNLLTKEKAQLFLVCFLPVFSLLAGGEPSVMRATAMAFVVLIANMLKFKLGAADILSIVFLVTILMDKYIIYHVGFQFSFIVTLGLLLSRTIIAMEQSLFMQSLQISFISQMMIIPLQLNYFSTFQPLSILINTIVVPYFSVFVIPLMFLLLFLTVIPPVVRIFDSFFIFIHSGVLELIKWVDQFAYFAWTIGSFPLEAAVGYYVLFFLLMYYLERGRKNRAFTVGVLLTALIIGVGLKPHFSPYGTVTMLDIGQGDAFVVELPYQKGVIMIDAGASFSFTDMEPTRRNYDQVIKPYLNLKGISKIDALILTHDDMDHMGSAAFIIEELKVDRVIVSPYFEFPEELAILIQSKKIDVEWVERGDLFTVDDHPFYVLGPAQDYNSANDNSLILYTNLGGKEWLFTGDVSKEQERELVRAYPNLTADVLKVAHHGSKTSSDESFLVHIDPEVGLISVGENNSYGHPSKEVLDSLQETETMVLRTDEHGAVQYRYKEESGTFYQYLP